jgi:hypothetical protein
MVARIANPGTFSERIGNPRYHPVSGIHRPFCELDHKGQYHKGGHKPESDMFDHDF